ncbi:hypothetical protein FISHEDRAFT_57735 [Fistulina hepatica ATCC 64428]|uniref:Uncharacterized protein n=1 Tax=Fistulina hepatica ATCC 64428 TaxID=1128425 RepID=A0A0D7AF39_9AGAR|nr:hypothetical protein FISHEDRAFT_57735 [Fistulina hepatica ATCC 64428]
MIRLFVLFILTCLLLSGASCHPARHPNSLSVQRRSSVLSPHARATQDLVKRGKTTEQVVQFVLGTVVGVASEVNRLRKKEKEARTDFLYDMGNKFKGAAPEKNIVLVGDGNHVTKKSGTWDVAQRKLQSDYRICQRYYT